MPSFTVIGVYDDGQTFADFTKAADAHEAMRNVAYSTGEPASLQIIGAVEGEVQLVAACDESGNAAYATDLIEKEA